MRLLTRLVRPLQFQKQIPPLAENIREEERYIEKIKSRYTTKSTDGSVISTLHRLNSSQRSFFEEINAINSRLPPMKLNCRISLLMPASGEENHIENTLEGWTKQCDIFGNPLEKDLFEILLLVNRPNKAIKWDETAGKARRYAARNGLNVHVIEHSFNFPEEPIEKNGALIGRGVRMGLIFRMLGDLGTIRSVRRGMGCHLMHPTGADVYARNPYFLAEVFDKFSTQETGFLKLKFDLPAGICTHMPLLWALQRYRLALADAYFEGQQLKRHGVFRTSTYAKVGGFSPTAPVGEDTDFGLKILNARTKVVECADISVIDNPRRSLSTIIDGKKLIEEYSGFGIKDGAVKEFSIAGFLARGLPPEAIFTRENFAFHASAHFRAYIRKALKKDDFEHAFPIAEESAGKALLETGFLQEDFEIIKGTSVSACGIRIIGGDNIGNAFADYIKQDRPAWME
ncbi:hypothetical protein JXA56_05715 [Candidatus Micrarchaeota archaeon]|nr:hypothetical protein [Candidatus Micrarchaeota archaeon]